MTQLSEADVPDAHPHRWRMLALLATAELLGMALWFSASAVSPRLQALWSLSESQAGWLTGAVQLGFVAGTAAAALLNLAVGLLVASVRTASGTSSRRTWYVTSRTGSNEPQTRCITLHNPFGKPMGTCEGSTSRGRLTT